MPSLFETLKAGSGPLWQSAQSHPFVDGLADGSLPREKFIHYLKQDYVYLIGYAQAWARAAAKAPDLTLLTAASGLVHDTLGMEMELHRSYCEQFGISRDQLNREQAGPICRAYVDFCLATSNEGDFIDLLVAMIPCGVGYAEIGTRLATQLSDVQEHPYRQWIETYASAEFWAYADWMTTTLDGLSDEIGPARIPRLQARFDLGCRYEWMFWEMGWTMGEWPI
ncbi:thiaminase II [bacterium]|nr:thiaminase II [bacterium]UNM09182.1 MAG: thiaminase II [Planctomycetales bacterium]